MSKKLHPRETQKALCDIADYYGQEAQLRQLMEECAELTQACNKYLRCTAGGQIVSDRPGDVEAWARQNIIEEIADVDTVVGQIMYLLNISLEDVRDVELAKIQRTLDRMEEQKKAEANGMAKFVLRQVANEKVGKPEAWSMVCTNCGKGFVRWELDDIKDDAPEEMLRGAEQAFTDTFSFCPFCGAGIGQKDEEGVALRADTVKRAVEIIKAYRICNDGIRGCRDCPFAESGEACGELGDYAIEFLKETFGEY